MCSCTHFFVGFVSDLALMSRGPAQLSRACHCGCGLRTKKKDADGLYNAHIKREVTGICRQRNVLRTRLNATRRSYIGVRLRGKTPIRTFTAPALTDFPTLRAALQPTTPEAPVPPALAGVGPSLDHVSGELSAGSLEDWLAQVRATRAEPAMGKGPSYLWLGAAMNILDSKGVRALLPKFQATERARAFRAALAVFAAKLDSNGSSATAFARDLLASVLDVAAFKEADLRLLHTCIPASTYVDNKMG